MATIQAELAVQEENIETQRTWLPAAHVVRGVSFRKQSIGLSEASAQLCCQPADQSGGGVDTEQSMDSFVYPRGVNRLNRVVAGVVLNVYRNQIENCGDDMFAKLKDECISQDKSTSR
ncbi:hypothetical protein CYMTET_45388 [Cymbomonas tetramitiformis]|uniref:Uncharacterized protein n=1 Tax=Cymbomonas tetramitiformis TaxID=36881 RepID=A0AAE0BZM8_9CHLO|nr:hypothetical protein CYMTET_45388 [Cymbomonas tetramitiformis]